MEALLDDLTHLNDFAMPNMISRGKQIDDNISNSAHDEKKLKYHLGNKKNWMRDMEKLHNDIEKINKKILKMTNKSTP
jgi:peptidoglycan hydrolase CwlO-like protein